MEKSIIGAKRYCLKYYHDELFLLFIQLNELKKSISN